MIEPPHAYGVTVSVAGPDDEGEGEAWSGAARC